MNMDGKTSILSILLVYYFNPKHYEFKGWVASYTLLFAFYFVL